MEYTIKQFANLSGVSPRTLRYYDEIDLLPPKRINESGYRIYGENEVNRLQEILLYRKMGMTLNHIKQSIHDPLFDRKQTLENQRLFLLTEKNRLDNYLETVENSLAEMKGEIKVSDKEKFDAFKKEKLAENERLYQEELQSKYPQETLEASKKQWHHLTQEQFRELQQAEREMISGLNELLDKKEINLESPIAKGIFENHKKWLFITAPFYNAAFHKSLGQMYVEDERFATYYNKKTKRPSVQLLSEIIEYYTH